VVQVLPLCLRLVLLTAGEPSCRAPAFCCLQAFPLMDSAPIAVYLAVKFHGKRQQQWEGERGVGVQLLSLPSYTC